MLVPEFAGLEGRTRNCQGEREECRAWNETSYHEGSYLKVETMKECDFRK